MSVKIMTYNIRYANDKDGENAWSKRKDHLTGQIKFYEPHILAVQEALAEQLEHFKTELPEYDFLGIGRNGRKAEGESTAIFFKKTNFEILKESTFWLSETPDKTSKGWDAKFPRICTYCLFETKKTGKKFWIFNTHFDHIGTIAREESAKLILRKIDEVNAEDYPVLFMGDLNAEPETKSVKVLEEKMHDSRKISRFVFGPEGTFNAFEFHEPVTRCIDYIFTSKEDVKVQKYAVLSDSKNLRYPSDHFPVLVEVEIE